MISARSFLVLLIPALVCALFCAGVVSLAADPQNAASEQGSYAGERNCKKCHIKRHKAWRGDKHAVAFDNIEGAYRSDPECLKCHTTGHDEGGFVSLEKTPTLTGVQCEQCHGVGSEHIPMMSKLKKDKVDTSEYPEDLKINPRPATCIKCHTPHARHMPVEGYFPK